MGATSTHRPEGQSTLDFFTAEFPVGLTQRGRVLASAVVRTGERAAWGGWPEVFYAAVEKLPYEGMSEFEAAQVGKVVAIVVPFIRGSGYYNITYKEMDEEMGPGYAQAPARILDLLSPTDSEWANEWRAGCRAHVEALAKARSVREGDTVVFAEPVKFGDGWGVDRLILDSRRRGWWHRPEGTMTFRLAVGDLVGREYEIERAA